MKAGRRDSLLILLLLLYNERKRRRATGRGGTAEKDVGWMDWGQTELTDRQAAVARALPPAACPRDAGKGGLLFLVSSLHFSPCLVLLNARGPMT